MPLDPPVMTATLPSSFPMTFPFVVSIKSLFSIATENVEMGPPAPGAECGSAHIGGAKSIRPGDRRQPRRSVSAVWKWAARVDISYDGRAYCCSMCWISAGLHHDRLG